MPSMTTLTSRTTDPIDLAGTCMEAANIHAERATTSRANGDHPAAGVDREEQRYYMKRAELYLAVSQAQSLQRIADALDRFALSR